MLEFGSDWMNSDVIIVMGVSGCGKSTVGKALAERLGRQFFDADDFHPVESLEKMREGIPLNDADREPWLQKLNQLIQDSVRNGEKLVLACSALKDAHRQTLAAGEIHPVFIYLRGSYEEILARMESRSSHFMPLSLLRSQFDALQEPADAWVFESNRPVDETVDAILTRLEKESSAGPQTDARDAVALDTSLIQNGLSQCHGFLPAPLSANTITSFRVSRNSSTFIGFVR